MAEFNAGSIQADAGLDLTPFEEGIARAVAEGEDFASKEFIAKAGIDTSALGAALGGAGVGGGGDGGGGGGGGLAAFLGSMGMAGGGGRMGLPGWLGFGAGAFGAIPHAAPFTPLAFAGLGMEHLLMTGASIGTSAIGGALGGGILGAGALATAGVGAGTNLAGIGQAAGDIKSYNTALDNLNKAIAVYGAGSTQAAHAQAALNYTVAGFPAVAVPAIIAAQQQTQVFKTMFDQATGAAEAIGANIINQTVQMAEKFLPTIGSYATQNMQIIQSSLQPLFQWLSGPGLQIFSNFESRFTNQLPTAMHIFTQGIELVMKMLDYAAGHLGDFLTKIDAVVSRLNQSKQGTQEWQRAFDTMFADFHAWAALFVEVFRVARDILNDDQHTGIAIVQTLTGMLTRLDAYLQSSTGRAHVQSLFYQHKQEVIALLQLLPNLIGIMGQIELAVGPALTQALTLVLHILGDIQKIPLFGTLIDWGIALAILNSRLKPVENVINFGKALQSVWTMASELVKVAWTTISAGLEAISAGLAAIDVELSANIIGLIIVGLVLLGVAAYELVRHWDTVKKWFGDFWKFMHSGWGTLITGIIIEVEPFIGLPLLIVEHWKGLVGFFTKMWSDMKKTWDTAWGWIKKIGDDIKGAFAGAVSWLLGPGHDIIWGLVQGILGMWGQVANWFRAIYPFVMHIFDNAIHWLVQPAHDIVSGFWTGLLDAWHTVDGWFLGIQGAIIRYFFGALSWLLQQGLDVIHGFWNGIKQAWTDVTNWLNNVGTWIQQNIPNPLSILAGVGHDIVQGLLNGITGAWHLVTDWIGNAVNVIPSPIRHILGIGSPSRVMAEQVGRWIPAGIAMGIKDHWTDVTGELSKGLAQLTKPVQTATLTMAHAVAGPAGAAAGVTAVRQGPAIHIEQVILKDQTDMRAFMNMADFYIQQGRVS